MSERWAASSAVPAPIARHSRENPVSGAECPCSRPGDKPGRGLYEPRGLHSMSEILFIKTSSLGDVIHHLPALTEARRRLPAARFSWVVEEAFAPLVGLHPAVDEVIPVATRRWRARAAARRRPGGRSRASSERYAAAATTRSSTPRACSASRRRSRASRTAAAMATTPPASASAQRARSTTCATRSRAASMRSRATAR